VVLEPELELLLPPQAASVPLTASSTPSEMWTLNRLTFCPPPSARPAGTLFPPEGSGTRVPAIVCTLTSECGTCQGVDPLLTRD